MQKPRNILKKKEKLRISITTRSWKKKWLNSCRTVFKSWISSQTARVKVSNIQNWLLVSSLGFKGNQFIGLSSIFRSVKNFRLASFFYVKIDFTLPKRFLNRWGSQQQKCEVEMRIENWTYFVFVFWRSRWINFILFNIVIALIKYECWPVS